MRTDVRQSSLEARDGLLATGRLSTQMDRICAWVAEQGVSCTLQEISRGTHLPINTVSGRVNDAKAAKRLHEWPRRKCAVTGSLVTPVFVEAPAPHQLDLIS